MPSDKIMKDKFGDPFSREGLDMDGVISHHWFDVVSAVCLVSVCLACNYLKNDVDQWPCSLTTTKRDVQLRSACPRLGLIELTESYPQVH